MAYADFPYYQDFYLGSMIRDPTAFGLLNGETSGLQDYLKSICIRYLGGSGLLYRGV